MIPTGIFEYVNVTNPQGTVNLDTGLLVFLEDSDNIWFYEPVSTEQHVVPLIWGKNTKFQKFVPVTAAWYSNSSV